MRILEGDLHILAAHIRDGRYDSVAAMLTSMDHETAYALMSCLSDETLNTVHFMMHKYHESALRRVEQMSYASTAAVTILRTRGTYRGTSESDVASGSEAIEKLRAELAGTGRVRDA
jgi:hypothetical protein